MHKMHMELLTRDDEDLIMKEALDNVPCFKAIAFVPVLSDGDAIQPFFLYCVYYPSHHLSGGLGGAEGFKAMGMEV